MSMKTHWKKFAFFLLFWSAAVFSFGENYFNFSFENGYFTDHFTDDDYSRHQVSLGVSTAFYYFPADFPLGLFARISLGSSILGKEENARESMTSRHCTVTNFRTVMALSYRFKPGNKVHIPISLGPTLVYTSEKCTETDLWSFAQDAPVSFDHSYQSLNGGIHADASAVFLPSRHFFLRPGFSLDYIFLRAEKGTMWMNYRTTHNDNFEKASYYSFTFTIYFGLGIKT